MKTIKYTVNYKGMVDFACPACKYETSSPHYMDELIYTDELSVICPCCKENYKAVRG